ncbi:hypothetical protein AMECASPLE_037337 [Ameca splendens]|uniref:Uncharacterized protein n=1 Tax=Ameca splendens TaxID=208324 RepID=A0ABV0XKX9_9TELE
MLFPTWALKSLSRMPKCPRGELSSTPNRDAKKAGYSAPLLGLYAETIVRDLSLTQRRRDVALSSTGVSPNTRQLSWGRQANPPQPSASPQGLLQSRRVQPNSTWVPEPTLCVKV